MSEEKVGTMATTTQQGISPIHRTLTTPRDKNTALPQTNIQSTIKPSVAPKYSQMDYQMFRPKRTSRQSNKQKLSQRNNFSELNYNYVAKSKPRMRTL